MTTEVLRNMIYAGASALDGLRYVVLDEVHYLQDAYRGPVWEEVIIHLPPEVRLVCLSATVSNADELAEWLRTVRGPTALVLEERAAGRAAQPLPGRRPPERAAPPGADAGRRPAQPRGRPVRQRQPGGAAARGGRSRRPRRRFFTPRRTEVIDLLGERGHAAGDLLHLQPGRLRRRRARPASTPACG